MVVRFCPARLGRGQDEATVLHTRARIGREGRGPEMNCRRSECSHCAHPALWGAAEEALTKEGAREMDVAQARCKLLIRPKGECRGLGLAPGKTRTRSDQEWRVKMRRAFSDHITLFLASAGVPSRSATPRASNSGECSGQ